MRRTRLVSFGVITLLTTPLFASGGQHDMHTGAGSSELVAQVREITERFKDPQEAINEGYAPSPACVSGPVDGAMGIHFVKMGFLFDNGRINVSEPEALIYEPRDGALRLVGVEYIVTVKDWHDNNPPEVRNAAPVLDGQLFQFVDAPNRFGLDPFYELHVWAWRNNPRGAFVDWNTLVSCEGR